MQIPDDMTLVREFSAHGSEAAFETLVTRHVSLVYSAALRQTDNPHVAEEVTQAVFIILARKAAGLGEGTFLTGWLFNTTRYAALAELRGRTRRRRRETEAYVENSITETSDEAAWLHIVPFLDEALAKLSETDRQAVLLRYFEGRTLAEVGATLTVNEDAARKRVARGLEKLRKYFLKRGVTLTAVVIAGALSANAVQASPAGLATQVVTATATGTAVTTSITTIVKGTLKMMTWMKLKFVVGASVVALLAGGTALVAFSSGEASSTLSLEEIFKKAQDRYDSLTSYSDEGKTVSTVNGMTLITTFTVKLGRPNFYRIEWNQPVHPAYSNKGVVWSSGNGDFMVMGDGNAQNEGSREKALSSATGISGSAAATVPGTFFKMNWGNQLGGSTAGEKQLADEKVGNADCYVFTSGSNGRTKTLWIGKHDFLIHQVRTGTSAEAMKAALAKAAEMNSTMAAGLPAMSLQGVTSTETHTNIMINQKFSPADFER